VNQPRSTDKPFAISKQAVWEAFRKVRSNQGAPGTDGQTIEEFEADLRDNLYRVWNVRNECGERVIGR
jgi:RNA-directed DNA polymerase